MGLTDGDITKIQKIFPEAFAKMTKGSLVACPPVIYLPKGASCSQVQEAILSAKVLQSGTHPQLDVTEVRVLHSGTSTHTTPTVTAAMAVQPDTNRQPQPTVTEVQQQSSSERPQPAQFKKPCTPTTGKESPRKRFRFKDLCTRCGIKIIHEETPTGEKIPVQIELENGSRIDYKNSKCHPTLIPKHYKITKFVGGVAHVVTLGTVLALDKVTGVGSWPGFTNSEEICPICNKPPGTPGCLPVHRDAIYGSPAIKIETNHSTTLDMVRLDEE